MVPFRNVTFSVWPKAQAILADNTLDNIAIQTASTGIMGYLEMQDAGEVFRTYDVMLQNPAILQINIPDYMAFVNAWIAYVAANPSYAATNPGNPWPDAQIKITSATGFGAYVGSVFRVEGRGDIHDDGLQADHASFILDQVSWALG